MLLSRFKPDGSGNREFIPLKLERDKVVFFPLAWTIVHPIDEASPLYGATPEDLRGLGRRVPGPPLRHRRDLLADGAHPLLLQGGRDRLGRPLRQPLQPAEAGRRAVDRHRPPARLRAHPAAGGVEPYFVPKSTFGAVSAPGAAWK